MRFPAITTISTSFAIMAASCGLSVVGTGSVVDLRDGGLQDADGGADPIGNGAGTVDVTLTSDSRVNEFAAVSAASPAGSTSLTVDAATGLEPQRIVIVWQVTTADAPHAPAYTLAASTGRYALNRIISISGNRLELASALAFDVDAAGAQVVLVPEYASVKLPAGVTVRAKPWDGRTGGILAFLATGAVVVDGTLSADGAGFRGAPFDTDTTSVFSCQAGEGLPSQGYAPRGEGIARARYAASMQNVVETNGTYAYGNSGSGGPCHNGGGGGGGHVGAGGRGGDAFQGDPAVGRAWAEGGASLVYDAHERLALGGGGGAGEQNDGPHVTPPGAGGGVVFVRAASIAGGGAVRASGNPGGKNPKDSGSGGGAGGAVLVRASGRIACGVIDVSGGAGGDGDNGGGPGGGGGGGLVALGATNSNACTTNVGGGLAGSGGAPRNAAAGVQGASTGL